MYNNKITTGTTLGGRPMDLTEFLETLNDSPDKMIPWYDKAETVCKSFTAKTHKKRGVQNHVYVVLLKGVAHKRPGYALYVGKTIRKPEVRFQQHKNGEKASRYVKKYGDRLLPELFEHLNPMSQEEATELEVRIAEALKKAGIPTYGGH
jgi:hypothetical protein